MGASWCPLRMLKPVRAAQKPAQGEDQACQERGCAAALQVPAQPVGEQRTLKVNQNEAPVQYAQADLAALERQVRKEPVERVAGAEHLPQERLAAPLVGIPEREAQMTPLGRLKLEPGEFMVDHVRADNPGSTRRWRCRRQAAERRPRGSPRCRAVVPSRRSTREEGYLPGTTWP
jgi:hypothetical protein